VITPPLPNDNAFKKLAEDLQTETVEDKLSTAREIKMGVPVGNTANLPMKTFVELHREFTQPREFAVALCCPDCKAPLAKYSCSACGAERQPGGTTGSAGAASLLSFLAWGGLPIAFGVFGALAFGRVGMMIGFVFGLLAAKVTTSDMVRARTRRRASEAPEVLMAQRYQDDPATYDQAAACYLAWLTQSNISSPRGFVAFLRNYRCYANALVDQRTALFNGVLAQVCGHSNSEDIPWSKDLIDSAFTGSAEQQKFLESFLSAKAASGANEIHIYPFRRLISDLESCHARGLYMDGTRICPPGEASQQRPQH
jgi:hypothetical protein